MHPRTTLTVTLIGIAASVGIIGMLAIPRPTYAISRSTSPTGTLFLGNYTPASQFDVADLTVEGGRYRVAYQVDVRYTNSTKDATAKCGLASVNDTVGFLSSNSFQTVRADDKTRHLVFAATYVLPAVTVELRCSPSVAGQISLQVTHVHLSAEP
jgi:hypothetical protein